MYKLLLQWGTVIRTCYSKTVLQGGRLWGHDRDEIFENSTKIHQNGSKMDPKWTQMDQNGFRIDFFKFTKMDPKRNLESLQK